MIFAVMGTWLYMRYRRLKRERAGAGEGDGAVAGENGKSTDTVIDYSREVHELNDLSGQRDGSDGKQAVVQNGNGEARTTEPAAV